MNFRLLTFVVFHLATLNFEDIYGLSVSSYFTATKLSYFKSYGNVQLFSFEVPCDTWYLSVFLQPGKTSLECGDKPIYCMLSPYGLPLVDFTEYPEDFLTASQMKSQISFNMTTSVFEIRSEILKPRCGTWYLGLVLKDSVDGSIITNKDLRESCYYFVGGGLTSNLVPNIPVLDITQPLELILNMYKPSPYRIMEGDLKLVGLYKFRPPPQIVSKYEIAVTSCYQNISGNWSSLDVCPIEIASRISALPSEQAFGDNTFISCRYNALSECVLPVMPVWPTDSFSWYYLGIWANESVGNLRLTMEIRYNDCEIMESPVPKHHLSRLVLGKEDSNSQVEYGHLVGENLNETSEELDFDSNSTDYSIFSNSSNSTDLASSTSHELKTQCTVSPEMTRLLVVSSGLYTPIYFMSDSTGLLGNRVPVTNRQLIIIPFTVDSKFDSGGTLRLRIFLNAAKSHDEIVLKVCLQWRYVPLFQVNNTLLTGGPCLFGYYQVLSAMDSMNTSDSVAVPYPKPGTWFLALYAECKFNSSCNATSQVQANFELYASRCDNTVPNQCGAYGDCNEYSTYVGRVSACSCNGGYRGYACTDASNAIPDAYERTMFVTLSNLAFIPAIFLAINWGHFVPAAVYFYNMFWSSFYHWCDSDMYSYCILKGDALQFADFLGSVFSFWTTLITMATIGDHARLFAHVVGLLMISFATSWDRFSLWTFLAPFLFASVVWITSWGFRCYRRKQLYPHRLDLFRMIPGVVLAFTALAIYAFLETPENYEYTHGTWHILVMLSTCFLLPRPIHRANSCFPTRQSVLYTKGCSGDTRQVLLPVLDVRFWKMWGRSWFWKGHLNACCDFSVEEPEECEESFLNNSAVDKTQSPNDDTPIGFEPHQHGHELSVSPAASPVQTDESSGSLTMPRSNNSAPELVASTTSMSGLLNQSVTKSGPRSGEVVVRVGGGSNSPTGSEDQVTAAEYNRDIATYSRL